jgi:transcriptional regulator
MTAPLTNVPQGSLDMLILKVVGEGPIHGYAIAQRIQEISRDALQVRQGSLYPALHRLENRKLLLAEWKETDTGRSAKFYKLTAKGRRQLDAEAREWDLLRDAIERIMRGVQGEPV